MDVESKKPGRETTEGQHREPTRGETGDRETNRRIARSLVEQFWEEMAREKSKRHLPFSTGDLLRLMGYLEKSDNKTELTTEITWIDPDWAEDETEFDD